MALKLITPPETEPLTLEQVEGQVRLELASESTTVEIMIEAIRERAEAITRRALITQTWELSLDSFPQGRDAIIIPKPPLQSIESIIYIDVNGDEQTLEPLSYRVISDSSPSGNYGYVLPLYGLTWPLARKEEESVKITFKCGYGPLAVDEANKIPKGIIQWMLINVANLFENRESVVIGNGREAAIDLNTTIADGLIENYRMVRI